MKALIHPSKAMKNSIVIAALIVVCSSATAKATGSIVVSEKSDHNNTNVSSVIRPTAKGFQAVVKKALNIATDNVSGYSFYISMIGEEDSLTSGGGLHILPTSGSLEMPAPLDTNSWGFAIPTNSAFTTSNDFDYDEMLLDATGETKGIWAAIPKKSNMALIQKTENSGNYDLDIYYGFNISDKVMAGTYTGTILFTAIPNPIIYSFSDFLINPSSTDNLSGGDLVTITANVLPVMERVDIGDVTVRIGEGDCTNASGTIENGTLIITCLASEHPMGKYDAEVIFTGLDGSTHRIEKGYVVELQRDTDSIAVYPDKIMVDTSERLYLTTMIRTKNLTNVDLDVWIDDHPCENISTEYNESGYLEVICDAPEIPEAGISEVTLEVKPYQTSFHTELVVGNINLTTISYMQEMTPSICANTATPSKDEIEVPTKVLFDQRDGKEYRVSKLADGNCWMTQNLRIGGNQSIELTSKDSDIEDSFILPAVQASGFAGWNNSVARVYDTADEELGHLYNWLAATGGEGTDGMMADDVGSSICPKGWRLPSMVSDPGFSTLLEAYGWKNNAQVVDELIAEPFYFVFSGGYYYGFGGEENGEYWSASPHLSNDRNAYYLKIESLSRRVFTDRNKPRSGGAAIRCVARTQ